MEVADGCGNFLVYWELQKPCTLPSHFRFSASPRDTSWRPRRSKARTQRQSKIIQDPFGSYFGSLPQWFYVLLQKNAKVEYFNRVHHVSVSNNSIQLPTRVQKPTQKKASDPIRSQPAQPALRSCSRDSLASESRNISEQRQLISTVATRFNSLQLVVSVFDNSFHSFLNFTNSETCWNLKPLSAPSLCCRHLLDEHRNNSKQTAKHGLGWLNVGDSPLLPEWTEVSRKNWTH